MANLGVSENNDLFQAIERNDVKQVRQLLENGVSANARDPGEVPAIHAAIHYGEAGIVELLIEFGADVNAPDGQGSSPIVYAASGTNSEIVKILLNHGADVNARAGVKSRTPLMAAAAVRAVMGWRIPGEEKERRENLKTAELLIRRGAEINAVDSHGETALDIAQKTLSAFPEHQLMVDLLLNHGAKRGKN